MAYLTVPWPMVPLRGRNHTAHAFLAQLLFTSVSPVARMDSVAGKLSVERKEGFNWLQSKGEL